MRREADPVARGAASIFEGLPQLSSLIHEFDHDPFGMMEVEQRSLGAERSFRRVVEFLPRDDIIAQISALFDSGMHSAHEIFPTKEEILEELVPLAAPLRNELPFHTTNLNISTPTGFPGQVSINIIIRLYTPGGRNIVKIKVGLFADPDGELFWEVGYVDALKSLQKFRKNFITGEPSRTDYFLLHRLVDLTFQFTQRRKKISGIDLSPAYYHVLPLCLRLGGKPAVNFDLHAWEFRINNAYRHTLAHLPELPGNLTRDDLQKVKRRYVISWLFENGLMLDPDSNKPIPWYPPRLISHTR